MFSKLQYVLKTRLFMCSTTDLPPEKVYIYRNWVEGWVKTGAGGEFFFFFFNFFFKKKIYKIKN